MKRNISIIGSVGVPARFGGFETLVENLIQHGHDKIHYTVFCAKGRSKDSFESYKGAKLKYVRFDANGVQSIPYDITSMIRALAQGDRYLLILGVSGCIFLPLIKFVFGRRVKIFTNIDGLEWRRDKWGTAASLFLRMSERIAVRFSDFVIADNKAIAEYISGTYQETSTMIAYGGDHALKHQHSFNHKSIIHFDSGHFALSLCRIEPENNVHMILEAFGEGSENLVFIGNWDNSSYGRKLKQQYGNRQNILILDPVFDADMLFSIRTHCKFYVHGHSAGGTNPALVEMMFFRKPILSFDCEYNRCTTLEYARFFKTGTELKSMIRQMDTDPKIGDRLFTVAQKNYRWDHISRQYVDLLLK